MKVILLSLKINVISGNRICQEKLYLNVNELYWAKGIKGGFTLLLLEHPSIYATVPHLNVCGWRVTSPKLAITVIETDVPY